MFKILAALFLLLCGTIPAKAEPISTIIIVISQIGAAIGGAISAAGVALFGAGAWATIGGFLASPFGQLIVGIGLSLVSSMFVSKQKKGQNAPSTEAGKVNVRIPEPERWICAGQNRQGGGAIFGEFDAVGNFWYIIIHSDSILTSKTRVYFDDVEIQTNEAGYVTTTEFCLDSEFNLVTGTLPGSKIPKFAIWTSTYTETDPIPPPLVGLYSVFPGMWTAEHRLVGTTFSVVMVETVPAEHRHKVYRWRGPFGLGEPSVSLVGDFSNMYDPRDNTQVLGNRETYKPSRNPALIWAWFRTHRYGRGKPESKVNWQKVAEQANICDQIVHGIEGSQKRYECGIAIPESKERNIAEQEILLTCDGQISFDDDGKAWPRVGYYYEPTLNLTRNRDIVAMSSAEAQNGESDTQGVIIRYLDPDAKFTAQPSAAWINPLYYVEGETPKFLSFDVLGIQNHNQAMRIAKAIGGRSQPLHKILPTIGLRGLRARSERIVSIQYDNTFAGPYEIATPVEVDEPGIFCGFGAVPVDENRWSLLPGEEKNKPVVRESATAYVLEPAVNVQVAFVNSRIEARFDPVNRSDWRYQFQYLPSTDDPDTAPWSYMTTEMIKSYSYSGVVAPNGTYLVRWRTATTSGVVGAWSEIVEVNTSPISLDGIPLTYTYVGTAYSFAITATGGNIPYTFEDFGNKLPDGISVDSFGNVSGSATEAGVYPDIQIRVSDMAGNFRFFPDFTITVME